MYIYPQATNPIKPDFNQTDYYEIFFNNHTGYDTADSELHKYPEKSSGF